MNEQESALRATSAEPENFGDCIHELKRLQRTIHILIAADFDTAEKVDQAYEIAGWKWP